MMIITAKNMYFAILWCAWHTRFTRGSWTCRWLTLIVCTCCDSGRVDIFSSAEFFHSTNMFMIRSWSSFHVSVKINLYLLWFCIATLIDRLKNTLHLVIQPDVKPKPIVTLFHSFSRASSHLLIFASSFHWFTVLSGCFVIGQSDYFGSGFSTLNWKLFYLMDVWFTSVTDAA